MRKSPGRSYRFYQHEPLWPFGFSLSYTSWKLEWAERLPAAVRVGQLEAGVELRVRLSNGGTVSASKALLFFVAVTLLPQPAPLFTPPRKQLFAVAKVHVQARGSRLVAVNSSNVRGMCAFCTVDLGGLAAVRPVSGPLRPFWRLF